MPIACRDAHALARDLRNPGDALEGAKVEGAFDRMRIERVASARRALRPDRDLPTPE